MCNTNKEINQTVFSGSLARVGSLLAIVLLLCFASLNTLVFLVETPLITISVSICGNPGECVSVASGIYA